MSTVFSVCAGSAIVNGRSQRSLSKRCFNRRTKSASTTVTQQALFQPPHKEHQFNGRPQRSLSKRCFNRRTESAAPMLTKQRVLKQWQLKMAGYRNTSLAKWRANTTTQASQNGGLAQHISTHKRSTLVQHSG